MDFRRVVLNVADGGGCDFGGAFDEAAAVEVKDRAGEIADDEFS